MSTQLRRLRCGTLPLIAALPILLSACGTSATGAASGGSTAQPAGPGLQTMETRLNALYAGTFTAPPAKSPRPAKGKNVWLIAFDESQSFSSVWSSASQRAGAALGWQTHVVDGKGSSANALQGIREAIAARASAIVVEVFDCSTVKSGIEQAKSAGIVVIADQSNDCSPHLFDYTVTYNPGLYPGNDGSFSAYVAAWAKAGADWLGVKSDGKAQVIALEETDAAAGILQYQGFADELKLCSGCHIVDRVTFVASDYGPPLQEKVRQALLQYPQANAIAVPVADSVFTSGVAATLRASGRLNNLLISGAAADSPANIGYIRNHQGEDEANCQVEPWDAYSGMDALNRLFNRQQPVLASGNGFQLLDRTHNLPGPGSPCLLMRNGRPFDYERLFVKAWTGR
jgi:ribose transport system substrate-binding protein